MKKLIRMPAAALAAIAVLAACSGGGGGKSGQTLVRETPRVSFAPGNNGHYNPAGLPAVSAGDVRHMPIWRDNARLGVGVDQGNRHLRGLPTVGRHGETDVRHGRLDDGVGSATLQAFLRDTEAGQAPYADLSPPVTVSWDASASPADRQRIIRAVQMVNAALPEPYKMTVAANGSIPISFLDTPEYRRQFGNDAGWGISLYAGGIVINRAYSTGSARGAIILLAHEIMHTLEFGHPPNTDDYDTIIESGGTIYGTRQGQTPQPLSILYPIDREAIRSIYSSYGPWASTSLHIAGHGRHTAFGVALRNGYAEP